MNQILSVILVIAMAFSSMAGVTAGIEDAVSFEAKINMDTEVLMNVSGSDSAELPEETRQQMKVYEDVLNALTLRGVATKDAAELVILAGEDVALSIGMKNSEKGTTIASSLLSSEVLFVSAEQIEELKQQMTQGGATGFDMSALEAMQNLDKEQIEKDCAEMGEKLTQAIEAKKGETETGEFTVDGMAFTAKTPVNMTYDEFMELLLTSAKELAEKESMKPMMQMGGTDFAAEIDKALETLKNLSDEEKPTFDLAAYTDENGNTYYVCNMAREAQAEGPAGEKAYIGYGVVDGLDRLNLNYEKDTQKIDILSTGTKEGVLDVKATIVDNGTNADITASKDENGRMDMVCLIKGNPDTKLVCSSEPIEGDRTSFTFDVYYVGNEKPLLSVTGTSGKGGELVSVFEGEKLTETPFETLMDPTNTTASGTFQMKLIGGLMKTVTVVTKNVPEDTANWINAQIQQMMTPATTDAPQEEPAAVTE